MADYLHRATQIDSPEDVYPVVLYWRGQQDGPSKTKNRVISGFDHSETILGATILYPVLSYLRKLNGFSAWSGDDYVDIAITSLLHASHGRRIISMDYHHFDSSLSVFLLNHVDDILGSWFDEVGRSRVQLLASIANTIPIVVPCKLEWLHRNGGMPSGSVLTNLRDTIANLLAGVYTGIRSGSKLYKYELLGDDSVFIFENDMDPKSLSEYVSELGLESNPEKQFVSRDAVHFLQRWHSTRYMVNGVAHGVRSPFRALAGMTGYERFRTGWNKWMDTVRWIMQGNQLRNHSKFRTWVRDFLIPGDEVLQSKVSIKEIFLRAGGSEVITSLLGLAGFSHDVGPEDVGTLAITRVLDDLR
jgi:hypothetical protein